jgi:hypothetical protein
MLEKLKIFLKRRSVEKEEQDVMPGKLELKGLLLVLKGRVFPTGKSRFRVVERSRECEVLWKSRKWVCSCGARRCAHIHAVLAYLTLKNTFSRVEEKAEGTPACPVCEQNDQVIRRGKSNQKVGRVQRYYCKRCGRKFADRTSAAGALDARVTGKNRIAR